MVKMKIAMDERQKRKEKKERRLNGDRGWKKNVFFMKKKRQEEDNFVHDYYYLFYILHNGGCNICLKFQYEYISMRRLNYSQDRRYIDDDVYDFRALNLLRVIW